MRGFEWGLEGGSGIEWDVEGMGMRRIWKRGLTGGKTLEDQDVVNSVNVERVSSTCELVYDLLHILRESLEGFGNNITQRNQSSGSARQHSSFIV